MRFRNGCFGTGDFGTVYFGFSTTKLCEYKYNYTIMRFFDREKEIKRLRDIKEKSKSIAQFTVITGRRRIGKTSLVLEAFRGDVILYFFVSRKDETELCAGYIEEISQKLDVPIMGVSNSFAKVFDFVIQLSKTRNITLVIDEFQEFMRVNSSIYSDMQRIWDLNKHESRINLIVCGSVNSLMNRLFRDNKESLFGRNTGMINVKPFAPSVLKEIINEYNPNADNEDLLALYLFSGGIAKYVEMMMDSGATCRDEMLALATQDGSQFIDEGKLMLIDEFGKDYGTYFSILSFISQGYNTRNQLEDMLKKEIGGYLTRLDTEYNLVTKKQPILEPTANKRSRYTLEDNFLSFWFRFMYKYNYMTEIGAFDKLREVIERDYNTYSGFVLEKYYREKLIEEGKYTKLGYWHDNHGENEIDIVGIDELGKSVDFYEVKRNARSINIGILRSKAEVFLAKHKQLKDYTLSYKGLSIDDM